jgi:hypothetical protein
MGVQRLRTDLPKALQNGFTSRQEPDKKPPTVLLIPLDLNVLPVSKVPNQPANSRLRETKVRIQFFEMYPFASIPNPIEY